MSIFKRPKVAYVLHSSAQYRAAQFIIRQKKIMAAAKSAAVPIAVGIVYLISGSASATTPPLVLGELSYQKLLSFPLTSNAGLEVNVADGNLIMKTQDMNVSSNGPSMNVTRYFNDLGTSSGIVGSHNTLSLGPDVHITGNGDGSATYQGPSGFKVTYPSNGSGGYTVPANYTDAALTTVSGGGWKLTFNKSGEVYTFDSSGNEIQDASANGQATTFTYSGGLLSTSTDAQGHVLYFTNYTGSNVGKVSDNTGRYITYTYTSGQLTGYQDEMNNTWSYQYYDTRGNINQITDPRGYTDTLTYDSSNRITSVKFNDFTSAATTWTFTYNSGNTVVTDPLSHQTTYNYDTSGRVTTAVNAIGDSYGASWDPNNNKTSSVAPSTYATTLAYDGSNNLKSIQNPTLAGGNPGAKTTYNYSPTSHPYLPSSSNDAAGNLITYSYDTNGNLMSAANSAAGGTGMGTTTKAYQGDPITGGGTTNCGAQPGEVCSSTDANSHTTTYTYDGSGNVTQIYQPSPLGTLYYTYDSLSRPATYIDGNGSKTTYTYDNMDRVKQLDYAADASQVKYIYDSDGNIIQRNDGVGQTNWYYDGYNRVTKVSQSGKADITYTYDNAGNLHTETGPAGTTTYTYDNANQIASIYQSNGSATTTFGFSQGHVTSVSLPNGVTESIGYDRAGRETSIVSTKGTATLVSYTGSYINSTGNDTALLQTETNGVSGVTSNFGYDGLNRLTADSATGTGANSYTYTYDNNGNRTQYSHNGTYSAIYGFNSANELTTAGGAASGSFDNNGNQTSDGTGLAFAYNAKNQTLSFTPPSSSAVSATYLDAGQTGRATIGSTTEQNADLGLYSDTTGSTTTYYTHLPSGTNQTIGETIGTSNYYYLTDLRGSVVKVTDISGNVQDSYTYDPYGQTLSSSGTVANPYGFQGGYKDSSTGLYKFGERYYNPIYATWTQLDPTGQSASYIFAGNDPINQEDPTGTFNLGDFRDLAKYEIEQFDAETFKESIVGRAGARFNIGLFKNDPEQNLHLRSLQDRNVEPVPTGSKFPDVIEEFPL